MMLAQDFRGVYAILPTPAKPGSDHWAATDTVDLEETARLVDALIDDGVDGLIALGTTGEAATVTPGEYRVFVDCLLSTVRQRVPVIVGTTTMGTHETLERARFIADRKADGMMLGLPMWQPLDAEQAARFYAGMSEALPDFAIMAYANARAFRNDFSAEFWARVVAAAPTVTSAKYNNVPGLGGALAVAGHRVNFMPNDNLALTYFEQSPETMTACWSTSAPMGPWPATALMKALRTGDVALAKKISQDIHAATAPIEKIVRDPALFARINIQMEKIRFEAAGYCRPGPIRPPYDFMPDDLRAAAVECGVRWAELCRNKYGPDVKKREVA
jgi:trans-o-hydroxybenzylidenepyruvate hydratase-aldolase